MDDTLAVITAVVLVASLLIVAFQARAMARQTELLAEQTTISNEVARSEAFRHSMAGINRMVELTIEKPELHPYLHEGKMPPSDDPELANRVLLAAELWGEALQTALDASAKYGGGEDEGLEGYANGVMRAAPCVNDLVVAHPDWWPHLTRLATESREEPPRKESRPRP